MTDKGDWANETATDQVKLLSTMINSFQETIQQLVEGINKLEDENRQLKSRNKVLQKRTDQGKNRPSLVLNLTTEELIENNTKSRNGNNNSSSNGAVGITNTKKVLDMNKANTATAMTTTTTTKSTGNLAISKNGTDTTTTNGNGNGNAGSSSTSTSNNEAPTAVEEFGQYLNATEIKQANAEMAKCKNTEQKYQVIWNNVARFVRKSQPTKAMGYLSVFGKEYDINYRNMEEDGMTLVHVACQNESANVLVLRFILTCFINVNVWIRTKSTKMTALDMASLYQRKDCIDALFGYFVNNDYISTEQRDIYQCNEKWHEYNNLVKMFDEYFKGDQRNNPGGGAVLYEKMMQALEDCLIRLIEDKKAFPMQIFYWVWYSHKNNIRNEKLKYFEQLQKYKDQKKKNQKGSTTNSSAATNKASGKHTKTNSTTNIIAKPTMMTYQITDSKLWKALKPQIEIALNWENLSQAPTEWYWFEYNFMSNPMWLDYVEEKVEDLKLDEKEKEMQQKDKDKKKEMKTDEDMENNNKRMYEEIYVLTKNQIGRGNDELEKVMKGLIEPNIQNWQKIVEYQYKNSVYRGKKQWRQDCIPEGLQCDIESNQLEQVSFISKSYDYDAKCEYDYNNYISQLCIRAHSLNDPFQEAIQKLFKEQIDSKKVQYTANSVKSIREMREKAYNMFRDCEFPTAAQILDVVRCCLAFNSIEEFWKGVECMSSLDTSNNNTNTEEKSETKTKISVMRCVNDFSTMKKGSHYRETAGDAQLPIPMGHLELKFNVIVSVEQKDTEAIGIVGEVAFTFKPMSDFQKKSTGLTQVLKMKEKCEKSLETEFSFDDRLKIAGTDERLLAPLFVRESHSFTETHLRNKDPFGKSLLTRFLQDKDTPADLIRNYVRCIPKSLMSEIWKAKIDSGRTPFMLVLQQHNAPVIKAVLECLPNYLRDELFKEKNNDGWTSLMLAIRYQNYQNIKAMIPYIPKDISLWQNTSTKGFNVLHCICQNENEDAHLSLTDLLEAMPEHIRVKMANTTNKDGKKPMNYATMKNNQKNGTSSVLAKLVPAEAEANKA